MEEFSHCSLIKNAPSLKKGLGKVMKVSSFSILFGQSIAQLNDATPEGLTVQQLHMLISIVIFVD